MDDCPPFSAEEAKELLTDEIEALASIYEGDADFVLGPTCPGSTSTLSFDCVPQDTVRITVKVNVPKFYPLDSGACGSTSSWFSFQEPRGISEETLSELSRELVVLVEEREEGCPILYDLVERAREIISSVKAPAGRCTVCLGDLEEPVIKTGCFHLFHEHCIGAFLRHSRSEHEKVVEDAVERVVKG